MRIGLRHSRLSQLAGAALQAFVAITIAAWSGAASAQAPINVVTALQSLPPEARSLPLERYRYFYDQRAYPNQQIPPGAYQRALAAHQQTFGPTSPAFIQNYWIPLGPAPIATNPTTSGRINSVAIDPTNTNVIYIGAATGGVWKTIDGGTSWVALTDTQCSVAMGSVAIDPSNHLVIYAGTGEENFSGDSYSGCGVLKSTDGGVTWTQKGASVFATPTRGAKIGKIAIHPTTTSTLLVASDFGLYRSTDSGNSFTQVLAGTATDLVIDPSNPNNMYAALGNLFGAAANGVYKSTDSGATWNPLSGGLPTSNVGRVNLAIAASSSSTVYASVQAVSSFALLGIFKTTNGGTMWSQLSATGASCSNQCWYDMYLAVNPTDANNVYFGGVSIFRSTDGGSSFFDIRGPIHVDQHGFSFQPGNPSTIVVGNDGGVFISTDSGSTWTSLNGNLAITQFYPGLSLSPNQASVALGGTQDNSVLLYNGSRWAPVSFTGLGGCDGAFTAIDFVTPTTGYGECQWTSNSGFSGPRISTNIGVNSFSLATNGINLADPGQFVAPLVMSPSNSQTLYFGTNKVYKTTNQGGNWTPSGTTLGGNVTTIAEAPSNNSVVYVGATNGVVYKSTNANASYSPLSGLPNRTPTYIAVHPTDANTVFVTFSGFSGTSPSKHVFKSTDGGVTWGDISGNLPDIPTNAILLDPNAPTTEIFVGTDLGVYRSNDGASWAPFNTGLPNVPVLDLKFNGGTGILAAATHGRGIWTAQLEAPHVATRDFNHDGKSDILWRDNTGNVALWEMNSTQVLNPNTAGVGNVPTVWTIVGTGDFNGDGRADVAWRDTSGNVAIWLMNATQVSNPNTAGIGNVPAVWSIQGTGDFNGDGLSDILWRDTSGNVAIWLMNGTQATNPNTAGVGTVPTVWTIVGTGDFNGDGKSDILWQDTSGNIAIWLMNGTAVTNANNAGVGKPPAGFVVVAVGDFNGDGKSDILLRDGSGNIAIWLMNGLTITNPNTAAVGNVNPVWTIVGSGDYNQDAMSDVLWRNTSTGDVAIWLTNGLTVTNPNTAGVGNVATVWTIQNPLGQ